MSNETIHQINVTKYFISLPEGDYDFQEHLTDYLLTDILNANKQINKLEARVKVLEEENEALKAQRDTYISLMNIYKNISKGRLQKKIYRRNKRKIK